MKLKKKKDRKKREEEIDMRETSYRVVVHNHKYI